MDKNNLEGLIQGGVLAFSRVKDTLSKDSNLVNSTLDEDNNTILLLAAQQGNSDIIDFLLANFKDKLNLNAQNVGGFTSLYLAAKNLHLDIVQSLLFAGADPNLKDGHGRTVFHWAAENAHEDLACLLASLSVTTSNGNNNNIIRTDIAAVDLFGRTALHWAAKKGLVKLTKQILSLPVEIPINAQTNGGETPLHWAALEGHADIVQLLLQQKADPLIKNSNQQIPLEVTQSSQVTALLKDITQKAQQDREANNNNPYGTEPNQEGASSAVVKDLSKTKPAANNKKLKITLKK